MRFNRKQNSAHQAQPEPAAAGGAGEKAPPALEERLQMLVEMVEPALAEAQARKQEQNDAQRRLAEMKEGLAQGWSEVKRLTGEVAEARRQAEEARKEIKPRSERMVAEAQQALAEARAEAAQERRLRADVEQRLETVEQSGRNAREALEHELTAAHAKAAAEAELRIAELEEMLALAHAEADRERDQRAEIERRLEALAASRAEAERAAAEATEAMLRVRAESSHQRERLLAIEQQLQALVAPSNPAPPVPEHAEMESDRVTAEPLASAQEEPFAVEGDWEAEQPEPDQPASEREASVPVPEELTGEELSEISPDREGIPPPRRRRIGKGRFRKQTGVCAVCKSTQEWHSASALQASGWIVMDDGAICADCQRLGWQLPEGGGLPFRRSTEKQTLS